MNEFKDKTAISTGAASGMGLLFAENFAALGGNVVMCDVNEQVLTKKKAIAETNSAIALMLY
ncbi:MAG: SDR family NAD(P)-dependent oxidoreductase [Clostridia bacterium]|nr:SDR family NAD(P)-dependent oxidoreductase [Clostridia bacterium]